MNLFSIFLTFQLVNSYNPVYYNNPNIHSLGNNGFFGKIHAELACFATEGINQISYNGRNIRKEILHTIPNYYQVLDLCCGIGISTKEGGIGVDTSMEMLNKAYNLHSKKKSFEIGNAETYYPIIPIDVTTCFFSFHEIPHLSRQNIIHRMKQYTKNKIIIVDISPYYKPKKIMLKGEPFLNDYLKEIRNDLFDFSEEIIIPNHVHMWSYDCSIP